MINTLPLPRCIRCVSNTTRVSNMLIQREHIAGKRVFRYEEATISSYIPNKNTCLVLGAAWGSENTLLSILVVRKNGWQNDSNSHFPFSSRMLLLCVTSFMIHRRNVIMVNFTIRWTLREFKNDSVDIIRLITSLI